MQFLSTYTARVADYRQAASNAAVLIERILHDAGLHPTLLTHRAKSVDSLRLKIFEHKYKYPKRDVTDLIGVRVVTYYRDEVDLAINALRDSPRLRVDDRRSIDKRVELKPTQFGYRSVHLIVQTDSLSASQPGFQLLGSTWFEIQVRSLLDHSWASIEHELRYKSKIDYPLEPTRRFAALAGTLELLDTEFEALRTFRDRLISIYISKYRAGEELSEELDTTRMIALMSILHPGPGWVLGEDGERALSFAVAAQMVGALKSAGIRKGFVLAREIRSGAIQGLMKKYARITGLSVQELSHLALLSLVVGRRKPRVLAQYFPGFFEDPDFSQVIRSRRI